LHAIYKNIIIFAHINTIFKKKERKKYFNVKKLY